MGLESGLGPPSGLTRVSLSSIGAVALIGAQGVGPAAAVMWRLRRALVKVTVMVMVQARVGVGVPPPYLTPCSQLLRGG